MLDPAGPQADAIALLGWIMAAGAAVVLVFIAVLVSMAVFGALERRPAVASQAFIVGGGVVLPLATLVALLVYALTVGPELARSPAEGDLRVQVIAHQWWWEVRYPGLGENGSDLVSANEVRAPRGRPVMLTLESADVIHSFWVPALGGKIDMMPGRMNRLLLQAERIGAFSGQCAEFCGLQHALMGFLLVVDGEEDHRAWLEQERRDSFDPQTEELRRGRDAFLHHGCGTCHTVRGIAAQGRQAPDLTHVGSRRSLGAGLMPNTVGSMAGWIAGAQQIKPGNFMPSYNHLDGPTLRAMAAWLTSLK